MGSGRRNVGNSLLDHAHRHHLPKGETHHLELQPASHICHLEKGVEDQSRGVKTTVEDFHSLSELVPPFNHLSTGLAHLDNLLLQQYWSEAISPL